MRDRPGLPGPDLQQVKTRLFFRTTLYARESWTLPRPVRKASPQCCGCPSGHSAIFTATTESLRAIGQTTFFARTGESAPPRRTSSLVSQRHGSHVCKPAAAGGYHGVAARHQALRSSEGHRRCGSRRHTRFDCVISVPSCKLPDRHVGIDDAWTRTGRVVLDGARPARLAGRATKYVSVPRKQSHREYR
jgi:hypothetical protein